MAGEARSPKAAHEALQLYTATALAASANGDSKRLPVAAAYGFVLDVTSAASAVDDTLDVYVQTKLDGTNWVDVVHFTQVLGNGGAKRYVAKLAPAAQAQAEFENGTALGAAAVRHLAGDEWRVRAVIANGAGTHLFSFTVTACPM